MHGAYKRPDAAIDDSLERLGLGYIDLMLVYQPGAVDEEVYKALERDVRAGKICSRWNMDNTFIRTDPAGSIKADKAKSTKKIDGAIALIMALDRAIRCGRG